MSRDGRSSHHESEMSGLSGAEYLASIFGTEKDRVNCSFFFKIGACRHGDKCSRLHNKPTFSQTVLLQNLYQQPNLDLRQADAAMHFASGGAEEQDKDAQRHFDDFFEEVFVELDEKYGEIEEMNVCDNLGEHMIGNVYVKFCREEDAMKGADDLNNRWFGQNPIYAELSPVTDFREACCRQYEMGECSKGGFCNFMHLKPISRELRRRLYGRRGGRTGVGGGEGYRGRVAEPSQRRLPLEDAESYINVKIGTVEEEEEDGRREDFERRYHSPTRDRSRRYR